MEGENEAWKVPISFNERPIKAPSNPTPSLERRPTLTLKSSIPSLMDEEDEEGLPVLTSSSTNLFLQSESPAVLISSDIVEDEIEDLMVIPKLPFEFVDPGASSSTASISPPSMRPKSPPPSQSPRPPPPPTITPVTTHDHKLAKQQIAGPKTPTRNIRAIDKSRVNTDIDGKGIVKWCSWCFHYAPQKQLETRWMGRNALECGHCLNETCVCLMCTESVCRSYGASADKLCFKCDGTYAKAKIATALKEQGRCSWCYVKGSHTLHKTAKIVGRNSYLCDACGRRTVLCRQCNKAFARGLDETDEELCAKCNNLLTDWDSARGEEKSSKKKKEGNVMEENCDDDTILGWCSWCVEDTKHELVVKSMLTRNTYRCVECEHRTLCCLQCEEGMSRSGVGWDDKLCVSCSLRNTDQNSGSAEDIWLELKGKKDAVFDPERYTHARVMTLLCLSSPFKEKALKEGMIRPFLVLVSMRPSKRNRISNELGWSSIPSALFGDAHAEAWEIVNQNYNGLQARLNSTAEKLNAFGRNVTWIEAVERVTLMFGSLDEDFDMVAKLSSDQCLEESCKPYSRSVQVQEHVLMMKIGRLYYKYLIANKLKPPQGDKATAIMNKIKDASGLVDTYGLTWAVSIFFKPKTGVPKFSETLDNFLTSRDDSQTARALLVVLEIVKQTLRLYIGFSVFPDDYYDP